MVKILELRSLLRAYYQKFQTIADPLWKFLVAIITLSMVNSALNYEERLESKLVVVLVSLLCAFTPPSFLVLFAMIFSILHVFAVSPLMAIIVFIVFVILYCFFLRFTPQYGYAVVAVPILYTINMPYAVPILLGLLTNPITVLPAACGVIVYYMFEIIKKHTVSNGTLTMDDVLPLYTDVFEDMMSRKEILVAILVFALVIVTVYVVRRMKMSYAAEIAILAGAVVNVFGFMICDLKFAATSEIGKMILGTLLSVLAAFVVLFFHRVFDYAAVENVQFEDDDYYYYVKAVPKVEIGLQERRIKRISEKNALLDEEDDEDDYEEILDEETGEVIFRSKNGSSSNVMRSQGQLSFIPEKFRRRRNDRAERQGADETEMTEEQRAYENEKLAAKQYESGMSEDYLTENDLLRMDERAHRSYDEKNED